VICERYNFDCLILVFTYPPDCLLSWTLFELVLLFDVFVFSFPSFPGFFGYVRYTKLVSYQLLSAR